jgi:hypothetical protein
MTDSPHRRGPGWGDQDPYGQQGYTDPAYANQAPYGPSYPAGTPDPTRQLPAYGQYGYGHDGQTTGGYGPPYPPDGPPGQPPPPGPSRRWLWVLAGVSVLLVLGLLVAVVVINVGGQSTVVAPPTNEPTFTAPSTRPSPTTTRPRPSTTSPQPLPFPLPSDPTAPSTPSGPTQPVTYDVDGTGRAISITYADTGGILQTEFNVMLPWSKSVELAEANTSASLTIINFGPEVTCSITVAGTQVEKQTMSGLTFCGASG